MSFDLALTARPAEIVRAVEALRILCETAGFPEHRAHDVALALDEVLANILRHGYRGDPRGSMRVRAEIAAGRLQVEVRDSAPPFNPLLVAAPDLDRPITERPAGGLGIHLLRQLAEQVEYCRDDGQNRLVLSWALTPEGAALE